MWLFELFFPQFCKSDMSRYEYLEVFQTVPWTSRKRDSTVCGQQRPRLECAFTSAYRIIFEPQHEKNLTLTCTPNEDSN